MRKKWNHPNRTAFYRVFMLQGALSLFFSLPIIIGIANSSSDSVTSILIIGAALWAFGFLFETVGDAQLDRFKKKENKDHRFIQHGLWKYTRHPNYFGESAQWFAIALIAATVPWGWISFISPIILTFFLLKISGVPLLEKKFMEHEEYREYAARTNKFIPGPPKN
ncbi:hypothetical protein CEY16_08975 [Halalkalibacillus sediminis]|uniref:Uncharacterized protein n=1 Tax=Halalkalibacillus sediminis TaxID=2018042 RepID=A0A2I0QUR0_9BACI|nr:hypothetical protein CEY16_08975 [Halalkalibacillus sediminis]